MKGINTKLFITIICLLIFFPSVMFAIGLGNIKIYSSINEPVNAIIPVIKTKDFAIEDMQVALAPEEVFAEVNLKRPYYLGDLQFKIKRSHRGKVYIHITTKEPMEHAFLNFVVDLRWPTGRLLRQYILMLNPPGYRHNQYAKRHLPPKWREAETIVEQAATSEDIHRPRLYGPITPTDELWAISRKVRPNKAVTLEQVAVAIYRDNPKAFLGNMNKLEKDVTLRIPTFAKMKAIPESEAVKIVQNQNELWTEKQKADQSTHTLPATMEASAHEQPGKHPAPAGNDESHKSLIPVDVGGSALEQSSLAPSKQADEEMPSIDELKAKLLPANKASNTEQAISPEAKDFLKALKKQNKNLEVEVISKDQELLEHERAFAKKVQQQLKDDEKAVAPSTPVSVTPKQPNVITAPALSPQSVAKHAASRGMSLNVIIYLVGLVLLLAVYGFYHYRKQQRLIKADLPQSSMPPLTAVDEEDDEPRHDTDALLEDDDYHYDDHNDDHSADADQSYKATTAADKISDGDDYASDELSQAVDDMIESEVAPVAAPVTKSAGRELSQVDILEEAMVYMAYNRFDQAKQVLLEALAEHSHRYDLLVTLLEVFAELGDKAAFDQYELQVPDNLAEVDLELAQKVEALKNKFSKIANQQPAMSKDVEDMIDEIANTDDMTHLSDSEMTSEAVEETAAADTVEPVEPVTEESSPIIEAVDDSNRTLDFDTSDLSFSSEEDHVAEDLKTDPNHTVDFSSDATSVDLESPSAKTQTITDHAAVEEKQPDNSFKFDSVEEDIATEAGEFGGQVASESDLAGMLDLAVAYVEINDEIGARELLATLLEKGDDEIKLKAQTLLQRLDEQNS